MQTCEVSARETTKLLGKPTTGLLVCASLLAFGKSQNAGTSANAVRRSRNLVSCNRSNLLGIRRIASQCHLHIRTLIGLCMTAKPDEGQNLPQGAGGKLNEAHAKEIKYAAWAAPECCTMKTSGLDKWSTELW